MIRSRRIRHFTRDDIPSVVSIRRSAFARSERPGDEDLADYLDQMFFGNPWQGEISSLVYMNDASKVVGFLGVLPRTARFRGEPIRVAVGTQLMVDASARGLAGAQLTRAMLDGPQDLAIADLANDVSRGIWEHLGGKTSITRSLHWMRVIRPWRYETGRLATRPAIRAMAYAMRPLWATFDRAERPVPPSPVLTTEPLTPAVMAEYSSTVFAHAPLHPDYDADSLEWLMRQVSQKRLPGPLRGIAVRDESGKPLGWFLYFANRGGVGQVAQAIVAPERGGELLDTLFWDAWQQGVVALQGRVEPRLVSPLAVRGARFSKEGPWTLYHSARPEISDAVESSDTVLSRLEGEWWMSF